MPGTTSNDLLLAQMNEFLAAADRRHKSKNKTPAMTSHLLARMSIMVEDMAELSGVTQKELASWLMEEAKRTIQHL